MVRLVYKEGEPWAQRAGQGWTTGCYQAWGRGATVRLVRLVRPVRLPSLTFISPRPPSRVSLRRCAAP